MLCSKGTVAKSLPTSGLQEVRQLLQYLGEGLEGERTGQRTKRYG